MNRIDSVSPAWIHEDDLLLKNSLEAGASLEALAKGAVNFSRGFTLYELRYRWHSLLYDPAVSASASARMVKFQQSGSNSLSRFSRLVDLKESEKASKKRKGESIRGQYYAMRKRIKNETFNSPDLGFFEKNNHNYSRQGHNFQDDITLNLEAQVGDAMFDDCLANNLGLEETYIEILRQAFLESTGIIATTAVVDKSADAFHTEGCRNSVENNYINGSMREDGLYKLVEDVCPLSRNDPMGSFDPGVEPKNDTHIHKVDSDNFVKCMGTEELRPSQILPIAKTFETDAEPKLVSTYGSMNESNQIICSGFGGKHHFISPSSDGSASFQSMGFSSPLPTMPLWRTMEDVYAPEMPVDVNNAESNLVTEETFAPPEEGDIRRENSPGYDAVQSMSVLGDKLDATDYINCTAVPEGEYADLPDSLLNLSNEDDILYMHVVAKDTMDDISGLQMLDSSKIDPEDALCNADVTTLLVASTSIATPSIQCHEESKDSSFHDQPDACHWEVDVPSTSVSHPDCLQLIEGKVICTLNTEDPEIPCNDDIFLLIHPSTSFAPSIRPQIATDSIDPLSSSADEKDGEQGLSAGKDLAPSFTRSQMDGPNLASEFDFAHPCVGYAFKFESSDTKSLRPLFRQPDKIGNPGQFRPTQTNPVLIGDRVLAEDGIHTSTICSEMSLGAEVGSLKMIDPEAMDNPSISDHDNSDSDGDIPHFSDIEAMILGMDLAYAQESCIKSEVARNQYNHSKRMIIRLEQTARSSLQRSMSSLGAFAIFYGRHFNYYIKKTEVTIGRSTDDTDVDIDLRKEGRANMISRRQATIKMETDGSFTLKNLGKSSISMNGNSIAHGQVAALSSSCLIEIKGMCFMFEINDKYVRRYLDDIIKKSQGKCKAFDWTPEGEP